LSQRLPSNHLPNFRACAYPGMCVSRHVLITAKRFDNIAQGRRERGAPWVHSQSVRGTPTGSDKLDSHVLRPKSRVTRGISRSTRSSECSTPLGLGLGCCVRQRTQGAPPSRRPWAVLFYAFGVTTLLVQDSAANPLSDFQSLLKLNHRQRIQNISGNDAGSSGLRDPEFHEV